MPTKPSLSGNLPSEATTRAWINLMRAQRRLLSAIELDLKAASLPPLGWYDVLLELVRADEGRLRPFEIEQQILLAQYNLSRLLDRLEGGGLVRREAFDEDKRGRWVIITDEGRAMQSQMWKVYGPALRTHLGTKLDDNEARGLADLLARLAR